MIDEDMFEEDKINRFLNMIATQYDGNLATQYASSYLKKCNEIKRLKESIGELTSRNVKASVYIQENIIGNYFRRYDDEIYKMCDDLLEILKGESDER